MSLKQARNRCSEKQTGSRSKQLCLHTFLSQRELGANSLTETLGNLTFLSFDSFMFYSMFT